MKGQVLTGFGHGGVGVLVLEFDVECEYVEVGAARSETGDYSTVVKVPSNLYGYTYGHPVF